MGDIGEKVTSKAPYLQAITVTSNHVRKFRVRVRRLGGSGLGFEGAVLGARVMHVQRHSHLVTVRIRVRARVRVGFRVLVLVRVLVRGRAHPRVGGVHRDEGAVVHGAAAQDAHPQRARHERALRRVLGHGRPDRLLLLEEALLLGDEAPLGMSS